MYLLLPGIYNIHHIRKRDELWFFNTFIRLQLKIHSVFAPTNLLFPNIRWQGWQGWDWWRKRGTRLGSLTDQMDFWILLDILWSDWTRVRNMEFLPFISDVWCDQVTLFETTLLWKLIFRHSVTVSPPCVASSSSSCCVQYCMDGIELFSVNGTFYSGLLHCV